MPLHPIKAHCKHSVIYKTAPNRTCEAIYHGSLQAFRWTMFIAHLGCAFGRVPETRARRLLAKVCHTHLTQNTWPSTLPALSARIYMGYSQSPNLSARILQGYSQRSNAYL
jgi:hypothetical protein